MKSTPKKKVSRGGKASSSTTKSKVVMSRSPAKKKQVKSQKKAPARKPTPAPKKTVGVKRKTSEESKKPTLSQERLREIQQIALKAKKNPLLTTALINRALKSDTKCRNYVKNIEACRKILLEQKEQALLDADETKKAKIEKKYADNVTKLDKIEKESCENPGILKPDDEAFLRKIHPKKPVSGYMKFAQEHRPEMKVNNPGASFGEMGRLIGQAWKSLSDDQKQVYITKKPDAKKSPKKKSPKKPKIAQSEETESEDIALSQQESETEAEAAPAEPRSEETPEEETPAAE